VTGQRTGPPAARPVAECSGARAPSPARPWRPLPQAGAPGAPPGRSPSSATGSLVAPLLGMTVLSADHRDEPHSARRLPGQRAAAKTPCNDVAPFAACKPVVGPALRAGCARGARAPRERSLLDEAPLHAVLFDARNDTSLLWGGSGHCIRFAHWSPLYSVSPEFPEVTGPAPGLGPAFGRRRCVLISALLRLAQRAPPHPGNAETPGGGNPGVRSGREARRDQGELHRGYS
jgi:hypothetical protein